jgi:hypothetical protein
MLPLKLFLCFMVMATCALIVAMRPHPLYIVPTIIGGLFVTLFLMGL